MPVSIRRARADDAAALARLTLQLGYSRSIEQIRASLSRILVRPDEQLLIAERDGHAVGMLHALVADYIDVDRYVHIAGVAVDADARREGIGRRLLEHAEQWARQRGCGVVRLSSSSTRTAAHRFYEGIGYANIKTQYSFAKAVDPAAAGSLSSFVPNVD